MQQKIIQVGNKKLLVLDMPKGANFNLGVGFGIAKLTEDQCVYYEPGFPLSPVRVPIPMGEYKIVGFKTDLTESQWAEIVGSIVTDCSFNPDHATVHSTSGLSLLQANDCNYNNALIIEIL